MGFGGVAGVDCGLRFSTVLEIVCSLIILYRRKRNVGGIVCGWFERSNCRKNFGGHVS
jgi:hypothetical protein